MNLLNKDTEKMKIINNGVIYPFSTPMWMFELDIDFKKAISTAYEIEKELQNSLKSNVGGYQSPNIDVQKYFPEIFEAIKEIVNYISNETEMKLEFDNGWLNINRENDFNILHTHPLTSIASVFYIKSEPNSGNIKFKSPTLVSHYPINASNKNFYGGCTLASKTGNLYLFPSYLEHLVEPNKSGQDRISLAVNFTSKGSYEIRT